jgi:hypothetical protein
MFQTLGLRSRPAFLPYASGNESSRQFEDAGLKHQGDEARPLGFRTESEGGGGGCCGPNKAQKTGGGGCCGA